MRLGAHDLLERGREGGVSVSASVEANGELVEAGLEVFGAQSLADALGPALEVGEGGVDPGRDLAGGPVADDTRQVAVLGDGVAAELAVGLDLPSVVAGGALEAVRPADAGILVGEQALECDQAGRDRVMGRLRIKNAT